MSKFPEPYKEIIQSCSLSHEEIASILKLGTNRWKSIFYGRSRMDKTEFKNVKNFIQQTQRKR